MKYFPILKKALAKLKSQDLDKQLIEISLNVLDPKLFKLLKEKNFKIRIKPKVEKLEEHDKLLASANLLDTSMDLYLKGGVSDDYLKQIPDSILHEIGHLVFFIQLNRCVTNPVLKDAISSFCQVSASPGGACSLLADNYIREKYGKKLRQNNLHIIKGVDIKFHENFAELFRIEHIYKIEKKLNKNLTLEVNQELLKHYATICLLD